MCSVCSFLKIFIYLATLSLKYSSVDSFPANQTKPGLCFKLGVSATDHGDVPVWHLFCLLIACFLAAEMEESTCNAGKPVQTLGSGGREWLPTSILPGEFEDSDWVAPWSQRGC